jgi:hypothetical protein
MPAVDKAEATSLPDIGGRYIKNGGEVSRTKENDENKRKALAGDERLQDYAKSNFSWCIRGSLFTSTVRPRICSISCR